jgi:hypothetical protein
MLLEEGVISRYTFNLLTESADNRTEDQFR